MKDKIYSQENFFENYNLVTELFAPDFLELKRLFQNYDDDPKTYHYAYDKLNELVKSNIDNKPCLNRLGTTKINDKEIKSRFIIMTYLSQES